MGKVPKGVRLNYQQGKLVEDFIRAHAEVSNAAIIPDRVVSYESGWDDRRVTEVLRDQIGNDLTIGAVRRFRATNIGKLAPGVKPGTKSARAPLQEQIAVLTQQVERLRLQFIALEQHVSRRTGYNPADPELAQTRIDVESTEAMRWARG